MLMHMVQRESVHLSRVVWLNGYMVFKIEPHEWLLL